MAGTVQNFLDHLMARNRVVLIGGLAVIAHGLSSHTRDVDIWLDAMDFCKTWGLSAQSADFFYYGSAGALN